MPTRLNELVVTTVEDVGADHNPGSVARLTELVEAPDVKVLPLNARVGAGITTVFPPGPLMVNEFELTDKLCVGHATEFPLAMVKLAAVEDKVCDGRAVVLPGVMVILFPATLNEGVTPLTV